MANKNFTYTQRLCAMMPTIYIIKVDGLIAAKTGRMISTGAAMVSHIARAGKLMAKDIESVGLHSCCGMKQEYLSRRNGM